MEQNEEKKLISKMSVKALGCNPRVAASKEENDTTPVVLCTIFGMANAVKSGEDNTGKMWTALSGQFEGVNLQSGNGETFQSGKLFLPSGIQEVIEAAVKELGESGGESVAFALEIRAVRSSNPIGYSYQAASLVPAKASDALATLREVAIRKRLPASATPAPAQLPQGQPQRKK